MVATLTRRFGDLDIAEEMAGEAFAIAVAVGRSTAFLPAPERGSPLPPTARRSIASGERPRVKPDTRRPWCCPTTRSRSARSMTTDSASFSPAAIPRSAMEARVALTLRMVGGLDCVRDRQRLPRPGDRHEPADHPRQGEDQGCKDPVPPALVEDLPTRLTGVLAVLYLIFNEGYLASDPEQEPVRGDLTAEAIRLTRLVHALMPADGEVVGLLGL